jgi:hypothetical protein
MEQFDEAWAQCEDCEGEGQIKNLTYDPNHLCSDGYDCMCEDSQDFFLCQECSGDGWLEIGMDD